MIFNGPIYLRETGNIAKRLQAAKDRKRMGYGCGPYMWTPSEPGKGRGFYQASNSARLAVGDSTFSLRLEYANQHLHGRMSQIRGYYCDSDQDQTLTPIVARLPHGRGFLAGWTMGAGMCGSLDYHVIADVQDAARIAHGIAENDAEREREYQERENERIKAEKMAEYQEEMADEMEGANS